MKLSLFLLADYASVREGLINVVSGMVTRVGKASFPGTMSCHFAAVIELGRDDHEKVMSEVPVVISVRDAEGGFVSRSLGGFGGPSTRIVDPALPTGVPITIDMSDVILPSEGLYTLTMTVGSETDPILEETLTFLAEIPTDSDYY